MMRATPILNPPSELYRVSDPDVRGVLQATLRAADALSSAGAHVQHLSIPMHTDSTSRNCVPCVIDQSIGR